MYKIYKVKSLAKTLTVIVQDARPACFALLLTAKEANRIIK